jgi:hypothetical protein
MENNYFKSDAKVVDVLEELEFFQKKSPYDYIDREKNVIKNRKMFGWFVDQLCNKYLRIKKLLDNQGKNEGKFILILKEKRELILMSLSNCSFAKS